MNIWSGYLAQASAKNPSYVALPDITKSYCPSSHTSAYAFSQVALSADPLGSASIKVTSTWSPYSALALTTPLFNVSKYDWSPM